MSTLVRLTSRLKSRHLTLLLAVARHRSLTRVAQEAGVSQPAATKTLAEIEDIFGGPLFTRARQGLQPTPLGQLALVRAQHMLQDLEHWADEIDALRSGHATHLNIGAVPFVSGPLLTRAIEWLGSRHRITVTLQRATTDHLLRALRSHELDCVIGRASAIAGARDVWHELLYPQRPALIANPRLARRLARRRPDWRELAGMNWILPSPATPIGTMVTELFVRAQAQPPVPIVETYSLEVIEGLLAGHDDLLSIVPRDIALELCKSQRVALVPWQFDWALPPISLIRRVREVPLQAEERFAEILRELCAAMGGD